MLSYEYQVLSPYAQNTSPSMNFEIKTAFTASQFNFLKNEALKAYGLKF